MYAYCVFAETNHCGQIAQQLKMMLGESFSPKILQREWVRGKKVQKEHDYLPGYVFVYTEQALCNFPKVDGVIRWLGNGPLLGSDQAFAFLLREKGGRIGSARVVAVGNIIQLADPAWTGLNGKIIKVDRRKERCCVEFQFDSVMRKVWVGFDMFKE